MRRPSLENAGHQQTAVASNAQRRCPSHGDHVIEATDIERVLVSANQCQAQYAQRAPVITDAELAIDGAGPLMGILAGLRYAQTSWLLVCPGDTPYLHAGWYRPLLDHVKGAPTVDAQ